MKLFSGFSVVMRHCSAWPDRRISGWAGMPVSPVLPMWPPSAMRIWAFTMSRPVTISVTVCSTWMRGFTSMK